MSMLSNLELIRRVPLFALLTCAQAEAVADAVVKRRFKRGEVVETPTYDFKTHRRGEITRKVEIGPILVVEGILLFVDKIGCPHFATLQRLLRPAGLGHWRALQRLL
jgi:hypothetical protein